MEKVGCHQLSIIIPTYNGEYYIENCINSIIKQQNKKIEIIVIDDDSSDRTVDIVKVQFGAQVKLIKNRKRLGMTSNYEKALRVAKGEWVSIMGQDDLMLPNSVSRILEIIDKNREIDIIVSSRSYYYWDNYVRDKNQIKLMIYKNDLVTRKISSKNRLFFTLNGLCEYNEGPQLYTGSIIRKVLIDKITLKQNGKFFFYDIPDVSSAISLLTNSKSYLKVFNSLFLIGSSMQSTGLLIDKIGYQEKENIIKQFRVQEGSKSIPGLGLTSSFHWYFTEAYNAYYSQFFSNEKRPINSKKIIMLAVILARRNLKFQSFNFKIIKQRLEVRDTVYNYFSIILITTLYKIIYSLKYLSKIIYSALLLLFRMFNYDSNVKDNEILIFLFEKSLKRH